MTTRFNDCTKVVTPCLWVKLGIKVNDKALAGHVAVSWQPYVSNGTTTNLHSFVKLRLNALNLLSTSARRPLFRASCTNSVNFVEIRSKSMFSTLYVSFRIYLIKLGLWTQFLIRTETRSGVGYGQNPNASHNLEYVGRRYPYCIESNYSLKVQFSLRGSHIWACSSWKGFSWKYTHSKLNYCW